MNPVCPNVLSPVPREITVLPCVTPVEGIRTNFFFVMVDANTIWMRELSCHCDICQTGDFKACPHDDECGTCEGVEDCCLVPSHAEISVE